MIQILELDIDLNGGFICWLKVGNGDTCIGGVWETGGFWGREGGTFIDGECIIVILGGFVDDWTVCLVNDIPKV